MANKPNQANGSQAAQIGRRAVSLKKTGLVNEENRKETENRFCDVLGQICSKNSLYAIVNILQLYNPLLNCYFISSNIIKLIYCFLACCLKLRYLEAIRLR